MSWRSATINRGGPIYRLKQPERSNMEYNRKNNGQFDTPQKVSYQCEECNHQHIGFEIHGMRITCPECGFSFVVGVDDQ